MELDVYRRRLDGKAVQGTRKAGKCGRAGWCVVGVWRSPHRISRWMLRLHVLTSLRGTLTVSHTRSHSLTPHISTLTQHTLEPSLSHIPSHTSSATQHSFCRRQACELGPAVDVCRAEVLSSSTGRG